MGLGDIIRGWIYKLVLKRSAGRKTFDIIEVRTKELTLTYINMETDVRIQNTFFLPITIESIETDIVNAAGTRVGKMTYNQPRRLKGNSSEVFTTRSKMSNITAFFNALQHLLSMPVSLRSIGTARVKVLWFTINIPVDDTFEVLPTQVRMTEELSEEEKQRRAERRQKEQEEREQRRAEKAKRKESQATKEEPEKTEAPIEENTLQVELNAEAITDIPLEIVNDTPATPDPEQNTTA
jgi:hypothetical protein